MCRRYPKRVIMRRALAAVLLSLSPCLASAQVRSVPAEAGRAPVTAPALSPSLPSWSGPSLTLSLSAPSLTPSLTPAVAPAPLATPDALISAAEAAPLPFPIAAAVPVALAAPVKPAARTPLTASLAILADRSADSSRGTPQDLGALFDGSLARAPLTAASTGDEQKPKPHFPAMTPKETKRAKIALVVAVPAAAALAIGGALAPHLALAAVHWLGQASYWLANPFAFFFTVPQIHRMLSRRSADVSKPMMATGLMATVMMTLNMAYDGKDLMLYRNLAQALGFVVMIGLQHWFSRRVAKTVPSPKRAIVETVIAATAITLMLPLIGPFLAAAIPGIALIGSLLVPIQIVAGFGFTYLMYAQLSKMRREHSAGDSSPAMMWAYLGTKMIWVWSLAEMLSLVTAPPWITMSVAALFIALCWLAGRAALARLLHAPWKFLPEKLSLRGHTLTHAAMSDILAFLLLSALILALSAGAYFAFAAAMGVPAAVTSRFVMYLLYTVQSYVACLATMKTLRERARIDKK